MMTVMLSMETTFHSLQTVSTMLGLMSLTLSYHDDDSDVVHGDDIPLSTNCCHHAGFDVPNTELTR